MVPRIDRVARVVSVSSVPRSNLTYFLMKKNKPEKEVAEIIMLARWFKQ